MDKIICGIQQLGIGVPDMHKAWKWYRRAFGMDIRIFEESADAPLMSKYTGNKVQSRTAALALNMKGGGGFEIWQYTSREPQLPNFEIQLGDLGIMVCKMKVPDVKTAFAYHKEIDLDILGGLNTGPDGNKHYFIKDEYQNIFQVTKGNDWFSSNSTLTGGTEGAIIGVSDIKKAKTLYCDILGYDKVIYDKEGVFDDLSAIPGGNAIIRRVLLKRTQATTGSFSKFFGSGSLELVEVKDRAPKKIFENRYWGDRGYIHLCFDIKNMKALKKECAENGFPFTVDSSDVFEMGEASGHFSYIEDPDGTLIEFVETYKIPLIKKIGWYLSLEKRDPTKPLPTWLLKMLAFNRVKD